MTYLAEKGNIFLTALLIIIELPENKINEVNLILHGGRASPKNGIFANVEVYPDLPQKF